MSKTVWGPPTWRLLHCMAIKAKDTMTYRQLEELKTLITRIVSNLPCPICSNHANNYFTKYSFKHIKSLTELIHFLFNFHNDVNVRTEKPKMTFDEHLLLYRQMDFELVIKNMIYTYKQLNNTTVTMMLYSFHRQSVMKDVNNYFVQNHSLFNS